MPAIASALPRSDDDARFHADPLGFMASARAALGDAFVLRDGAAIFSRATDCAGAIAVFGAQRQRAVLSDIETFGLPASYAEQAGLAPALVNLNRSLHSMRGDQHAAQKRALSGVLAEAAGEAQEAAMRNELDALMQAWQPGGVVGLLSEMRRLARLVAARVLFGEATQERESLVSLLDTYFQLRRELAAPGREHDAGSTQLLATLGESLDAALRHRLRDARRSGAGLVDALARELGSAFDEDQLVGHSNILFVSGTEPVAVALSWTLLILSQRPALRQALHEEATRSDTASSPLLDSVIHESLRLLPPNGVMVRITTRPTELAGMPLPANCELVLSPFVAHRDASCFQRPEVFMPSRWQGTRPSPFAYFPFGAGGHACVGRALAMSLLRTSLSRLLAQHAVVLAADEAVDWRLHIMFMPRSDPRVRIVPARELAVAGGALGGPVGALLSFED